MEIDTFWLGTQEIVKQYKCIEGLRNQQDVRNIRYVCERQALRRNSASTEANPNVPRNLDYINSRQS